MSAEQEKEVVEQQVEEKKEEQVSKVEEDNSKSSRGEKKFKKAMLKMGMKPVTGINRVTIKKSKQMMLYIDNPEILQTPGQDNSYIVFGEAKLQDFPGNIAQDEASKFKAPEEAKQEVQQESVQEQIKEVKEGQEEVSEEGLNQETIQMVIEHCKCTRQEAVRVLQKHNGDSVNAILELSE